MTVKEFRDTYCINCGTQRCLSRPIDISDCGYYKGDIEGIPKEKSFMEELEEEMAKMGLTWDDIRREIKGE